MFVDGRIKQLFILLLLILNSTNILAATAMHLHAEDIQRFSMQQNANIVLKPVHTNQANNDALHLRLQQQYQGIDVYGGYVILHKQLNNVSGVVFDGLSTDL